MQILPQVNVLFFNLLIYVYILTEESLPLSSAAADAVFTADHPFVFYVKVRDIVVLVGRVLDL